MYKLSWVDCLDQKLARLKRPDGSPKIAILGIGHELRGDDGAGVIAARILRTLVSPHEALLVIDAGPSAEAFTGTLRRFAPDLVILIDAAWMDEDPGAIRWLNWRTADGLSASTHSLPLSMFGEYLGIELNCQVTLIGIQAHCTDIAASPSPAVFAAAQVLARTLSERVRG